MKDLLIQKFPTLTDKNLIEDIISSAQYIGVKEDTVIIDIGSFVKSVPLVISGSIKVLREDNDANELFLYYLESGQTCAASLTCCMSQMQSTIRAVAEKKTEILLIPVRYMEEWMIKYSCWKSFVMNTYRFRFEELLNTIDSIAFTKMDERLKKYILKKGEITKSNILKVTHQEIAYELNSSREVISRLLKQLEKKGDIQLFRNKIEIKPIDLSE